MSNVQELLSLLDGVLSDPARLDVAVPEFQRLVWNTSPEALSDSSKIADVLRTLAYDLDFYVPNQALRAESDSYFGKERALAEIRTALDKLRVLGAA